MFRSMFYPDSQEFVPLTRKENRDFQIGQVKLKRTGLPRDDFVLPTQLIGLINGFEISILATLPALPPLHLVQYTGKIVGKIFFSKNMLTIVYNRPIVIPAATLRKNALTLDCALTLDFFSKCSVLCYSCVYYT